MSEFTSVGSNGDFVEGHGKVVVVEGLNVAVFRVQGQLHAMKDACPHMGASLADGTIVGDRVRCFMHDWSFDLATGDCGLRCQRNAVIYDVRLEGDRVLLRPPAPAAPPPKPEEDDWIVFDPDKHLKK